MKNHTGGGNPYEIEIFAAGDHTSSNGIALSFSNQDLDAIAQSYNPDVFDAPAVVGHPRDNSPAYGWVESVKRVGAKLIAKLRDIDPEFEEAVKAKRYKKISASFYSPDSPANPNPGTYYLRHVGFLGGMAPAVKGLKPVAFSEDEGVVEFSCGCLDFGENMVLRNLREWLIADFGLEKANEIIPNYAVSQKPESDYAIEDMRSRIRYLEAQIENFMRPELQEKIEELGRKFIGYAEQINEINETNMNEEIDFNEREASLLARERQLAEREAALNRARVMDFVESRASEGRVFPAEKAELIEFMCALPEDAIEFSEEKFQAPREWFENWLKNRPKVVEYAEVATASKAKSTATADPKAVADKATAIVTERRNQGISITFAEAVQEVMGGK
ncbi:hypothetical protein NIES4101_53730 [Calothrix sp. NIES-4101]|nr:hypothetical protein NIES4101_53730 [Calothrix sp. NIES-4101]